jgi:hypothetical protein
MRSKPQPAEPSPDQMCERFWTLPDAGKQPIPERLLSFLKKENIEIGQEIANY